MAKKHATLPPADGGSAPRELLPLPERLAPGTGGHRLLIAALLAITATLAFTSLVGDSLTFDETSHLTAGLSYWKTGDFRYTPDHPPFGKMWAALPLVFVPSQWPASDAGGWVKVDSFDLGRAWLCGPNDGQRLLIIGRSMVVLLLLATCGLVYALARRLWGPGAALLALFLACWSPTLLAHGRLVTTDMPIAFFTALTLLTAARLAERLTWGRVAALAGALAGAAVSKMSWPMLVPTVGALGLWTALRRRPWDAALPLPGARGWRAPLAARRRRLLALVGVGAGCVLAFWLAVWSIFGWRYAMLAPLPPGASAAAHNDWKTAAAKLARDREATILSDAAAGQRGAIGAGLHFCEAHRLLPEAYLLGVAQSLQFTAGRRAYLCGGYSDEEPDFQGWRSYFPIAFLIKTPLATQLLLVAALAALLLRAARPRDAGLLIALLTFAALYGGSAVLARLHIGHRHLLPLYPVLLVLAGGAAAWARARRGRLLVGAALAWLCGANLWVYPHYLAYFNEIAGGPGNGWKWLADSNIDWGQDLVRLGAYSRAHPNESIKLAYFGSAAPTYYVPGVTALPSHHRFTPRADFTPGTYVISLTQLVGVYFPPLRDNFWRIGSQGPPALAQLAAIARQPAPEQLGAREQYDRAVDQYKDLAGYRLIQQLHHRPPDERIGCSMFLYRLSQADLDALLKM